MIPSITKEGNYHPVELMKYVRAAEAEGKSNWQMARELKVSKDRINYMLGVGLPMFERRARVFAAMERQVVPA